ncbi:ester cyclase [Gloeobacter morelensis]|uniref:Nuclear transport factor 2 family protein n=1 Tax=Gloeobacter morelensis MG652769 TaxID=2781736 RepID=A0ABY3PSJ2_9CYAN|nr:nuclear transport factor 2 family protein [Gloeobacter morelensis]UFP96660.1 nuclear transport factor 2 family protein [Gloeobacter morelensis MG652769]
MNEKTARDLAYTFIAEGIAKADLTIFDALLAEDIVVETGLSPAEPIRGREAYKAIFAQFADAWPVQRFEIHAVVAEGNLVAIQFTATALFEKDYYGVKATGQIVPLREIHLLAVDDGRIVRNTVGGVNLPFEYIMYPVLKDVVLGSLQSAP